MKRKSIFDLRGANSWIMALGVAANLLWSFIVLILAFYILDLGDRTIASEQLRLLIGEFIGSFLIGWFCGWLAFDDRGATYEFVGALGSVFMIMLTLMSSCGALSGFAASSYKHKFARAHSTKG